MTEPGLSERIAALRGAGAGEVRMPRHPDVSSWRAPTPDDIDAIHTVAAAADAVDHPTWITPREDIADTFDLPHIDHARDSLLALDAGGAVVGFGSAFLHPAREGALTTMLGGAVHPDLRGRGIGAAILAWQRARGLEQLAEALPGLPDRDGSDGDAVWTADLKVYGEESQRGLAAIAERAGFTAERWFTTMERDMADAVASVPIPDVDGVVEAVAFTHDRDDDARLARNDAFRDHWGSLPSQPESWAKFVGGPFFRADLSRLATDRGGRIVGFCLASVNEEDWEALGASHAYIDLIGVVRGARGRGVAPFVIAASLAAIADAGLERAVLDVDTASPTGANTLYERLGFRATQRSVAYVTRV